MRKIIIKGVEYDVSDRVKILLRKVNYKETMYNLLETILPSDNYNQGKISETTLLAAMIDCSEYTCDAMKWEQLLTSKVYGLGLVPFEVASKLLKLSCEIPWKKIDDKFERKVINEVDLKLLFGLLAEEDTPDAQNKIQARITNVLNVLLSDEFTNLLLGIINENDELVRIIIEFMITDKSYIKQADKMFYIKTMLEICKDPEFKQLLNNFRKEAPEETKAEFAFRFIRFYFSQNATLIGAKIIRALGKKSQVE